MSTAAIPSAETKKHLLLSEKDVGVCKRLTGHVTLSVIFVQVPMGTWDAPSRQVMKQNVEQAMRQLESEASAHGASLHLSAAYYSAAADEDVSMQGGCCTWAQHVLCNDAALPAYRVGKNDANGPVIFCLNAPGRAFAMSDYSADTVEFFFVYQDSTARTIRHELMHLYGALDYYNHDDLRQAAERFFPDSIMLSSREESRVDALTAYLLGWTDTLTTSAVNFLAATKHLTQEMISNALRQSRYTGYRRKVTGNGVYTGMLQDGIRHGLGRMEWHDGTVYEGQWANGERTGYGVYTWPDGDSYAGEFQCDERTGQGTYFWANGNVYTGDFQHNKRTGRGTFSWSDGSTYAGGFLNGEKHGKGVLTWEDGSIYTGDFQHDKRTGQGTYTWPDGSTYAGGFRDGKLHGEGIRTSADGRVTRGRWVHGFLQL